MHNILKLLYPQVCGICGKKIIERYTCRNCLNIIKYYKEMEKANLGENSYIDYLLCAFPYSGVLKSQMLKLKFYNQKYIAKSFGELLSNKVNEKNINADFIIPVPISFKKKWNRGFNQSELIAKYLSNFCKIPLKNKVLLKVKNNKTQSELDAVSRHQNVKGVYGVSNSSIIKGKKIILLDDIYTTGATILECAKVLKEAGAKEVIGLTVLYSAKNN